MNPNVLCSSSIIKELVLEDNIFRQYETHTVSLKQVEALPKPDIQEIKLTKNQKAALRRKRRLEAAKKDPSTNANLIILIKKARRELTKLSTLKRRKDQAYEKVCDYSLPKKEQEKNWQKYYDLKSVYDKKYNYCLKLT